MNWLWADVIIRQQSKGAKTLDDFCKLFHGAPSTGPMVKPYTFDDVVNTLNQIVPYDWRGFWTERLTNHGPGAPLGGIEGSGWKVVYDETPSEMERGAEGAFHFVDAAYSLGLNLNGRRRHHRHDRRHARGESGNRPGHETRSRSTAESFPPTCCTTL